MADAALENAMARKAAQEQEIEAILEAMQRLEDRRSAAVADLARTRAFIRTWYEMAGIQQPATEEQKESEAPDPAPASEPKPKNPNRKFVTQKCVEYIREAGKPLMRSELFERLAADGIVIQGKDPEMVLSTMLWRTKDLIRRLKAGGYWPRNDRLPPEHSDDFEDLIG